MKLRFWIFRIFFSNKKACTSCLLICSFVCFFTCFCHFHWLKKLMKIHALISELVARSSEQENPWNYMNAKSKRYLTKYKAPFCHLHSYLGIKETAKHLFVRNKTLTYLRISKYVCTMYSEKLHISTCRNVLEIECVNCYTYKLWRTIIFIFFKHLWNEGTLTTNVGRVPKIPIRKFSQK